MIGVKRLVLVCCSIILLAGCSSMLGNRDDRTAISPSDGRLISGRYATRQGTVRYQREFALHVDGRVTETQSLDGTDRFASFLRDRYEMMATNSEEFAFSKEDRENRMIVRATRTYPSLAKVSESGSAEVQMIDSLLFRSMKFKSETGAYDPDTLVRIYGMHEQATHEDWVAFLRKAVQVHYIVKDEATGRTYRWERTAGEIGSGAAVVIADKQWRRSAYYGAGAVAVVLLFVVYMGLYGRRHWDTAE